MRFRIVVLIIIFLSGVIVFLGLISKRPVISNRIIDWYAENCSPIDECVIDLNEVTDFQWDRVYVSSSSSESGRPEVLVKAGIFDNDILSRRIVFLLGNEVVYHEKMKTHIEYTVQDSVVFQMKKGWDMYTSTTGKFLIKYSTLEDGYYKLTPQIDLGL